MHPEKQLEVFKNGVKLVILCQAVLEIMDDFKGTKLYKQDTKNLINKLEKKMERLINEPMKNLTKDKEEFLLMQISRGVDKILKTTLEEIALEDESE